MKTVKTEVCVIGAGAGGTGCVYQLLENGINVAVADKNCDFGGTMVFSGVDGWEPGVSLDGIHQLLKEELESMQNACHVVEQVPNLNMFQPENGYNWDNHDFSLRPWGLGMPTGKTYEDTMKRCILLRGENGSMNRFQFEPDAMRKAINNLMSPYKDKLTTFFGFNFTHCEVEEGKVTSVTVSDGNESVKIYADYFVDASGDIVLAREAGCDHSFGTDAKELYNEPCATTKSDDVNAVTYVFRISKTDDKNHIDTIPEDYRYVNIDEWKSKKLDESVSVFCFYPNGDININMLPTMEGKEYFELGEDADKVGRARVYAYWEFLQKNKNMQGYTIKHIFDAGVRESYRLNGRKVLTENHIRSGEKKDAIAIADHALDVHGKDGMCRELDVPYGIPIDCTMTKEYDNLFVACRGASFSHIASSSIRLTRTMLQLGEGVGKYLVKKIRGTEE